MRRRHLLLLALALAAPVGAVADDAPGVERVSGPSPLAGHCEANDRTLMYGDEAELEEELAIAVNPSDPGNIVVAWNQDLGLGIVAATTHDGGQHWQQTVVPGLSACTGGTKDRVIHPRLSFGPDGVVYLLSSPLDAFFPDPRSSVADIAVSRSHDGGLTWAGPVVLNELPAFNDLGGMTAEPDVPGAAVVVWSHAEAAAEAIVVGRTTDHGRTFQTHDVRLPTPGNVAGKSILAHPDGTLLVFVREDPIDAFAGTGLRPQPITVLRSADKGATWSAPAEVVADDDGFFWPLVAADAGGRTYLVSGATTAEGALELWLRRSDDAGATWDAPRAIGVIDAAQDPKIAVNGVGGVAISVADLGTAENGEPVRSVWLLASADRGDTWERIPVAGPFPQRSVEHWVLGAQAIGYATAVAGTATGFRAAFTASGDLAEHGLTDVVSVVPRP